MCCNAVFCASPAGPLRLLHLCRSELDQVDRHPAVSSTFIRNLTTHQLTLHPGTFDEGGEGSCLQIRRCGTSSRLVAAAYLHASGHGPDLCSQMASPSLWAQMATAQPRLSVAKAAQPATPSQAVRAAPAVMQLSIDMSEGSIPSPPFEPMAVVTPVHLQANTPVAEVSLCPGLRSHRCAAVASSIVTGHPV
jgi:hypothetical protein